MLEDWWGPAKLVGQFKEISADCLFRNIWGDFLLLVLKSLYSKLSKYHIRERCNKKL